jgi:molybdate transport system permease protein
MSRLPSPHRRVPQPRVQGDGAFLAILAIIAGTYVLLIVAMLLADATFTTPGHLVAAFQSPNIRYAIKLSLISCTITMILSVWVAVPIGYLMSRYHFRGKSIVDTLLDVPIVLPPLVVGLSLLILFQMLGRFVAGGLLPLIIGVITFFLLYRRLRRVAVLVALVAAGAVLAWALATQSGQGLQAWIQQHIAARVTYAIPSVILAQFSVACAFSVHTMRVTFDQISPRSEQVAMTLGCSRSQAFWKVVLPEAGHGILTAGTIAWARSLGEFGPILVFAGATRLRTEVLSTTVFLELSVGRLESAVAVSLLMVIAAFAVLLVVRRFGRVDPLGREL